VKRVWLLWKCDQLVANTSTNNTHKKQTSGPTAGLETAIHANERPQTYTLNRVIAGMGLNCVQNSNSRYLLSFMLLFPATCSRIFQMFKQKLNQKCRTSKCKYKTYPGIIHKQLFIYFYVTITFYVSLLFPFYFTDSIENFEIVMP
jgi:hypothetical protein